MTVKVFTFSAARIGHTEPRPVYLVGHCDHPLVMWQLARVPSFEAAEAMAKTYIEQFDGIRATTHDLPDFLRDLCVAVAGMLQSDGDGREVHLFDLEPRRR